MRKNALDNDEAATTSFSRLVTSREFKQYSETNDKEHKRINLALWGDEGTSGVVATVNSLDLKFKIMIGVVTFAQPLIFALIIRWLGM